MYKQEKYPEVIFVLLRVLFGMSEGMIYVGMNWRVVVTCGNGLTAHYRTLVLNTYVLSVKKNIF